MYAKSYNPVMRALLCCLLLGAGLSGQSSSRGNLASLLMTLQEGRSSQANLSQQLVGEMLSAVDSDRKPSRKTVAIFADELTGALVAKRMTNDQAFALQSSITDLLRGSATNLTCAVRFRRTLVAIRVDEAKTQSITRRFIAIGEEVRGPDDIGISRPVLRQPK